MWNNFWNAIWTAILPDLTKFEIVLVIALSAALIVWVIKFVRNKIGPDKFQKALIYGEAAMKIIIEFLKENPEVVITGELILEKFTEQMALVMNLQPAEIDYVFNTLKNIIINAIGLDPKIFANTKSVSVKSTKKLFR